MLEKLDALRTRMLSDPVIIAVAVGFLLRPPGLRIISPTLNWVLAIGKIVVALFVAAFFLARPRLTAATAAVGVYYALTLVSTLIHHTDMSIYGMLNDIVSIGVVCVLVDMAVDTDMRAFVKGMFYYLAAVCIANLVTVVLTRCGIGYYTSLKDTYLLGLDNSHGFFIVPLLAVAMVYTWNTRRPLWMQIGMLALFTVSVYITWSASAVVAVSAFIALYALWHIKDSRRLFNVGTYYAVIAAVFLLLVVFRVTDRFAFIFRDVLHKDVSLSQRVPLWEAAVPYVLHNPILGMGVYSLGDTIRSMIGAINCHNMYLQVAFDTGIVGSAVYLVVLGLLVKPLMRVRRSFGGYMLAAGLFAFMLILEVESLVWPLPFYMLYMLCYHAEDVVKALDPNALPGES